MTPDFKRLCEAAANVELGPDADYFRDWQAEAIVRAVLMELREPSQEMKRAADAVEMDHGGYRAPIGPEAGEAFTAMINAILAEPAKA